MMFRINADGSRRELAGLLLADAVLPDELEGATTTTPARELFELMKEACLGKLTNTLVKRDGTVTAINGAAYTVALRMANAPQAAAIVLALIHQFPWLKNQHTRRLIRSALQIVATAGQATPSPASAAGTGADTDADTGADTGTDTGTGATPDADALALTIATVATPDSDHWASVLAVDEHDQVITTIANGSIFQPHAVSPDKTLRDTQVKSLADAMQRFAGQLADPAPALLAKLQTIRAAAAAGRQVRLIVSAAARQQADLVADAVRRLPRRPLAPSAQGEYGALPARCGALTYTVRVALDILDGEQVDYRTGDLPIARPPIVVQRGWRQKRDGHWVYLIVRRLAHALACDETEDEDDHRFRHRTRRAGRHNGLHEEETNQRFAQHDEQILQMSPLEALEQAIATSQGERWALDYALSGDLDAETASWMTRFGRSREELTRPRWWRKRAPSRHEPTLLPPEIVAQHATIRDCRIKRFSATGALQEGWVIPAHYQLAGVKQAIKVVDQGRLLTRQEQRTLNHGACWEFPNVTAPEGVLPSPCPPVLRRPAPSLPAAWPPPTACPTAWSTARLTPRCFAPDPIWHEPLTDADTHHLIVTLNDSEHALARLVASLIR